MYWLGVIGMKRFFKRLASFIPSKRKLMQLYFAILFNANLKGYISGTIFKGSTKSACIPGLNCYSCPGAVGACPIGSLQGSFGADKSTWFYFGGIILLYCIQCEYIRKFPKKDLLRKSFHCSNTSSLYSLSLSFP